jgi:hypothetical protein
MTFPIKRRIPVYLGDIIVCLDKARPFSELKDGRVMLGNLTHFNIKTSNMKNKFSKTKSQYYTEREIAVPVCMCNRDFQCTSAMFDWTEHYSPITEIKNETLQKWWPRSIFKGTQKIGDMAEEIMIEHQKFIVKFQVTYAFTTELKKLFSNIEDSNKDIEATEPKRESVSAIDPMPNIIPVSKCKTLIDNESIGNGVGKGEEKSGGEAKSLVVIPQKKSKLKYVIGSAAIVLIGAGIFFGIRWFNRRKA